MWEPPFGDVELPPGEDPLVLVAPSTSQDRDQRLLRAALDGTGATCRCACSRPTTAARRRSRCACPRTRAWWSGCRTRAPCRTQAVVICHGGPRHDGARPGLRRGGGRGPGRRRHGRERRAPRVVGCRRRRCRTACSAPRTLRWAVQRVLERPGFRSRARAIAKLVGRERRPGRGRSVRGGLCRLGCRQGLKLPLGLRFQRGRGRNRSDHSGTLGGTDAVTRADRMPSAGRSRAPDSRRTAGSRDAGVPLAGRHVGPGPVTAFESQVVVEPGG